jgi:hypothetical protein
VHHHLTLDELDDLARRVPELRTDQGWVLGRLARTLPPAVDLDRDLAARDAHLEALWAQVRELPPVFASLRAHVAFHRVALDLRLDRVGRERLLDYLRVPRPGRDPRASKVAPAELASLDADFRGSTGLPPRSRTASTSRSCRTTPACTGAGSGSRWRSA